MSLLQLVNLKFLKSLGVKLVRLQEQNGESDYNDINSYMLTPKFSDILLNELTSIASEFICTSLQIETNKIKVKTTIKDFFEVYKQRPVVDNRGGSRFHNSFWLYTICSLLRPDIVVESGVWKGHSSWILRKANPSAKIYCFDPCFDNLIYKDNQIIYVNDDWSNYDFKEIDVTNSLCFFDDHINQAKRVREAYNKGFKNIIFDDAPPVHKLYTFGFPPVPTVDMLFDDSVQPGDSIEWMWKDKLVSYNYKFEDECNAREVIKQYKYFPDVSLITQFNSNKFLCLVQLKD